MLEIKRFKECIGGYWKRNILRNEIFIWLVKLFTMVVEGKLGEKAWFRW